MMSAKILLKILIFSAWLSLALLSTDCNCWLSWGCNCFCDTILVNFTRPWLIGDSKTEFSSSWYNCAI
jgi:hypothetical protein